MTQNQINYWNLQETVRANQAREAETSRHNLATEGEDKRHNVTSEKEVQRHNLVTEKETNRSNVAKEQFNIASLQETQRHNYATESLSANTLAENKRHNVASESIQQQQADVAKEQLGVSQYLATITQQDADNRGIDTANRVLTGGSGVVPLALSGYAAYKAGSAAQAASSAAQAKATAAKLEKIPKVSTNYTLMMLPQTVLDIYERSNLIASGGGTNYIVK